MLFRSTVSQSRYWFVNKLFGGTGTAVAIIGGLLGTIATYFIGKALIVNGVKALVGGLGSASGAA